jgi:hypothetical protein
MKKLTILKTLALLLVLGGCRKENALSVKELDPVKDAKLIAGIEQSPQQGIPFPEGTKAIAGENGTVQFMLPEGFHYIIKKAGAADVEVLRSEDALSVTCNCTKGNGCTPLRYKGKYYCVMEGGCSSCDKVATLDEVEVEVMGIYNENADITLLSQKPRSGLAAIGTSAPSEIIGSANRALFSIPSVKEGLLKLYDFIYEGNIPSFILRNEPQLPKGYRMVAVSVYGNIAAIPIPENMLKTNDTDSYMIVDDGGKTTCRCNDASPTGCEKDSFLGAVFCNSQGCKSCSLLD